MNVLYEEDGALKVGAILADNSTSLQVEAPHGKRSKVKASAVILRFAEPPIGDFMARAQAAAEELDIDFLWQCSPGDDFDYDALAREYYGRAPQPIEAAAVLLKLHGAPMYFYKRGRGRYKAAPDEALTAALAGAERRKQQALTRDAYVKALVAAELPPAFEPVLSALLYRPERNSLEWKALEEASAALKLSPARVLERCGGLPSTHDYHLGRFLFEHFPRGTGFEAEVLRDDDSAALPLADAAAFSIDDATTTEIDDAFSVTPLGDGNVRVGIHIAAPALGLHAESALDAAARTRLSTVYYPGGKITMLPPRAIEHYSLHANRDCPALSLYVVLSPADTVVSTETRVERVRITENLRHDTLEPLFNERSLAQGSVDHAHGAELARLWRWASQLERARRGDAPEGVERPEYAFHLENDRVQITRRLRGTPIDKVVSELMIHVNRTWGERLASAGTAALYRVQSAGKVRMSTVASAHAGLNVAQYVWASSPLRRYVDLVNQRQLIALARGVTPPYAPGDPRLPAVLREFESAYEAYGDFQRDMERYWCLRWLLQEDVRRVEATVLRENLCRFDSIPLVARVASLPAFAAGQRVALDVSEVDLLDLTFHCEFRHQIEQPSQSPAPVAMG